ncbi:hypothetical protein L3Q82_007059 [Scortum barcoo]|uniref:Uncharacterized protein n=1 Tax=Scortum barcoo TaxID=214431 RepID=A0ACB8WVX7_9TELE|nr:hypothetical protein L3Q82_007059 [Scortum barcoo]
MMVLSSSKFDDGVGAVENLCDEERLICQNGGTCVDFQRCVCPDNFTVLEAPVTLPGGQELEKEYVQDERSP